MRQFIVSGLVLLLVFSFPLYLVAHFSLQNGLYSHIILIPFVCLFLAWQQRDRFDSITQPSRSQRSLAVFFLCTGLGISAWYLFRSISSAESTAQDQLAIAMYGLVLLLAGFACLLLNSKTLRAVAYPLGFLIFLAPFPVSVELGFEHFLQHGSAVVAHGLFSLAGTPVLREGTFFMLPGFNLEVAPECSGINSTFALLLTSLVAGQVLLRSSWKRWALVLLVLPLALVRNGIRVVTIGELCVHVGPEMIDSYIHRHGGPIFFALSLLPFGLVLYLLIKAERRTVLVHKSTT